MPPSIPAFFILGYFISGYKLSKNSFYHRGDTLFIKNNRIRLEKIGWIKSKDNGRLIQGYFWKGNNLQSYYQD